MFFDKKAKEVEKLIVKMFDQIETVLADLEETVRDYIDHKKEFKDDSYSVHKAEHKADKIRREIGRKLYDGAFLPIYREDYFELIEISDKIANQGEAVADYITLTRPIIPEYLENDIKKIISVTRDGFALLKEMLHDFLDEKEKMYEIAKKIRHMESDVDALQFYSTKLLFKRADLEKADIIMTRDFIDGISKISNWIEDVSDRFEIIAAKHRL